jgi:hypothetical protein
MTGFIISIIMFIYFMPMFIAIVFGHKNAVAISALNFLTGWTVIGWLVSFIWSLTN